MPEVLKEITYLSEVECLVHSADALLNTQIIGVADESGNQQYLRVAKGSITRSGEKD